MSRFRPAASIRSSASSPRKIRAVIVTGHQFPGHAWQATTQALDEALRKDPRLSVETVTDVEFLAAPELHRLDLVVMNYCNWQRPGLSEAAKTNFIRFLASGGGLVIVHFANGAFHFSLPGAPVPTGPSGAPKSAAACGITRPTRPPAR